MRLLGTLISLAVVAGVAMADRPDPPLEKDEKEITLTREFLLGKGVSGYVFVQKVSQGPNNPGYAYERISLDEKKPKAMALVAPDDEVWLLAIPEKAAAAFKTDKDLFAALEKERVKGVHEIVTGSTTIRVKKATVKENSVTETYTITAITPGEGMKMSKTGGLPPAKK
jgi:hypothetical protein